MDGRTQVRARLLLLASGHRATKHAAQARGDGASADVVFLPQSVAKSPSSALARCPVCGDPVKGAEILRCFCCDVPHHPECWRYLGGCGIYACRGNRPEGVLPTDVPAPTRVRPAAVVALLGELVTSFIGKPAAAFLASFAVVPFLGAAAGFAFIGGTVGHLLTFTFLTTAVLAFHAAS